MMRRVTTAALSLLLLGGLARAERNESSTVRYQIARHLVQAGFDRFFPYGDGWRDVQTIGQKLEVRMGNAGAARNGAEVQQIRWRITDGPALGGEATLWRYGAGDRPAYYPTTDVGDVRVLGTGQGFNVSARTVRLEPGANESKASLARRAVRSHLQRQGFGALLAGRDLSDSGIEVRTRGNTVLYKAGLKIGGDGRKHYALGGRVTLAGDRATVEVNVGAVDGWRVAGPRNGSGRRSYFPSGEPMRRYPAYGRRGR